MDIVQTVEECGYQGFYEVELQGEEMEHFEYNEMLTKSFETVCSYHKAQ
jgi:hypothetical protein